MSMKPKVVKMKADAVHDDRPSIQEAIEADEQIERELDKELAGKHFHQVDLDDRKAWAQLQLFTALDQVKDARLRMRAYFALGMLEGLSQ